MELHIIDAFVDGPFSGNPAAVCRVKSELGTDVMQRIAAQNNLSETAFVREHADGIELRWFTPTVEVALCGHATLAAGAFLGRDEVTFQSLSGLLHVRRDGDLYELDFPALPVGSAVDAPEIREALGPPLRALHAVRTAEHAQYFLAEIADEAALRAFQPNIASLGAQRANVMVTAPSASSDVDFVSRFFAPGSGVDEDPATGSTHCTLTPYWSARLGREVLWARQLSERGGLLRCRLDGERVRIAGRAHTWLRGTAAIATD